MKNNFFHKTCPITLAILCIVHSANPAAAETDNSPLFDDTPPKKTSTLQTPDTGKTGQASVQSVQPGDNLFETDETLEPKSPTGHRPNPTREEDRLRDKNPAGLSLSKILSGRGAIEFRAFPEFGEQSSQDYNHNFSFLIEPQLKTDWDNGQGQFSLVPFWRVDEHDNRRTHFDLREFMVFQNIANTTLRAGIGRVFWGVTESRHTVDIINQSDLVENPDGEDKLGQPMLNVDYASGFGKVQFFFLPFSRPRSYPGESGRIRPPVSIAQTSPIYNGNAGRSHRDLAGRWSHSYGPLDIGISHFYGTTREPVWRIRTNPLGIPTKLVPVYDVINQTSLDLALAQGSWLWKLEAFTRGGQGRRFAQVTGGFEYTISGVFNTGADLGLLAEYLYDGRPKHNLSSPFDRDVFLATRIGLNDEQSTEILSGIFIDTSNASIGYSVEASRRIGESWKLNFEARGFGNTAKDDFTRFFRKEHYIMLELEKYF